MNSFESNFRDECTRRTLEDPKFKSFLTAIYRMRTITAIKNLYLANNWEETREVLEDWREMDNDIGMAVRGERFDDELRKDILVIKDVSNMLEDKINSGEIKDSK